MNDDRILVLVTSLLLLSLLKCNKYETEIVHTAAD